MRYMFERFKREVRDSTYRAYVTDQLRLIPQASYLSKRWVDMTKPKAPERTAEEIVDSVIRDAGLEVLE